MLCNLKFPIWLLLLASLAGCMTPRYQTLYRYEPPTDVAGKVCLEQCEQKLSGCKNLCQDKHQTCVKSIEPMIETRFQEKIQQYQRDLHFYQHAVDLYQRRLVLGSYYYDPRYGYVPYAYGYDHQFPPIPPFKPDRDQVAKALAQQHCDRDCGCQSIYDACFLSCGGIKIPEVKCVANCPPEK